MNNETAPFIAITKEVLEKWNNDETLSWEDILLLEPSLSIKISGKNYNATITGPIGLALNNFQKGFFQAGAFAFNRSSNASKLSQEERELLTINFHISQGSTDFLGSLKEPLTKLMEGFADMDSKDKKQVLIFLIGAIALAGPLTFLGWQYLLNESNESSYKHAEKVGELMIKNSSRTAEDLAKVAIGSSSLNFGEKEFTAEDMEKLRKRTRTTPETDDVQLIAKVTGFNEIGAIPGSFDLFLFTSEGEHLTVRYQPDIADDEATDSTQLAQRFFKMNQSKKSYVFSIFEKTTKSSTKRWVASIDEINGEESK